MTKLFPPYRFHLLVATLLVFLVGCQKDHFLPAPSASDHRLQTTHFPISIGEAQKHFEQLGEVKPVALNSLDEEKVYLGEVAPDWGNAFLGTAVTGQEMAIAPLVGNNLSTLNQGRAGIKLLFSKSGADSINVQLLVYVLDSSYQVSTHGVPSWSTFTGLFLFFDLAQNFKHGVRVINGVPMGKVVNIRVESGYQQAEDRGDGDCATHFTSVLTDCIMAFSDCSDVSIVGYEECGSGFAGGVSSGGGGSTTGGGNGGGGNGGGTTFIPDVTLPSFLLGFYNIPLNLWSTPNTW